MAKPTPGEVLDADYPYRLGDKIDALVERVAVAKGFGEFINDLKPRLLAMIGPEDLAEFNSLLPLYGNIALSTGAHKDGEAVEIGTLGAIPQDRVAGHAEDAKALLKGWTGEGADAFNATSSTSAPTDPPSVHSARSSTASNSGSKR